MSCLIEEIPINAEETPINTEETPTNVEEIPTNVEDTPAPKKRGRPVGAKSKAKPKAKVKKAPPVINLVADSEESEEEEPPPPKKKRRRAADDIEEYQAPPLPTSRDVAMEVLGMLSDRNTQRTNQRRAKYASWLQNPQY